MTITIRDDLEKHLVHYLRAVLFEPFRSRTWSELAFLVLGFPLAALGIVFVGSIMALGVVLAVTFFGLAVVALSLKAARGMGRVHRAAARGILGEQIDQPDPLRPNPGFFGWLQSSLRDRDGWRALAYTVLKVPLAFIGILTGFSLWFDAFTDLTFPLTGRNSFGPTSFGLVRLFFHPGPPYVMVGNGSALHDLGIVLSGIPLLLAAPWVVRVVVLADRYLMRVLLGPDGVTLRVRSLEQARTQAFDASAAMLRRIERDLHDGTQAQLVALAMRLGMAKEKLAQEDSPDLAGVRQLVDEAHRTAKDTIAELRDLVRGIHPPALDIGLEGALATLASRSAVPTELTVTVKDRPTPAIETIAYFCVAELLANVAQHAQASRASVTCSQDNRWLRLVVRDDGIGGARLSTVGSASSGLTGLTERVSAVDGRLSLVSPSGGPTVATVDLPLHA